jgi:hypothetical protein
MEAVLRENQIITPVVVGEKKPWCRVIHSNQHSDFCKSNVSRSPKGTVVVKFEIEGDHVVQIFNGREKEYFQLKEGILFPIKPFEVSKYVKQIIPIEFTIKVDPSDVDTLKKVLELLNSK